MPNKDANHFCSCDRISQNARDKATPKLSQIEQSSTGEEHQRVDPDRNDNNTANAGAQANKTEW